LDPINAEREVKILCERNRALPFRLNRAPLTRSVLFKLAPNYWMLGVCFHHIIGDGQSVATMYAELGELYEALEAGREAHLRRLEIQYADYAVWERESLHGEALARRLAYWRKQLSGTPVLEVPTDSRRPATPSHRGASVPVQLSKEQLRQL